MFGSIPWRKEKGASALLPLAERPFHLMMGEELGSTDRFFDLPMPPLNLGEEPAALDIEMEEAEQEVVVRVELPDFALDELDVRVRGDRLTIEAKHEEPGDREEARFAHVKRSVTLPQGTETDKIEARYLNGVLEVHVPRAPKVEGRRVEVKA